MKHNYFLGLIFMLLIGNVHAQIVNIPDANFKAALIAQGYDINLDNEIDETEALNIHNLFIENLNISSLQGIEYFSNLEYLGVSNNLLTYLDVSMFSNLTDLFCHHNQLTALDLSNSPFLTRLDVSHNQITSLNISDLQNLTNLSISYNQINSIELPVINELDPSSLDISGNNYTSISIAPGTNLTNFYCNDSQLTTLDLSNMKLNYNVWTPDQEFQINNNAQLSFINLRNGFFEGCYDDSDPIDGGIPFFCTPIQFSIQNNSSLVAICTDNDNEYDYFQNYFSNTPNLLVTNYCSFTPGGNYNTITGNVVLDCGGSNIPMNNQQININNTFTLGVTYANATGNYVAYTKNGIYNVTPTGLNPNYFTVSPASYTFNFQGYGNAETADFCLTPNGVHHDMAVTIIPTTPARPGFDASYVITYQNQGNQIESGNITLAFDDAVLDLVTATPTVTSSATNALNWAFANLAPFESRSITVTLNVNSPMETPAVNNNDVLAFTVTIAGAQADETPADNSMNFNQIVVGSFDPNDKAVVEGEQISIDKIGDYLHYVVRFQNTGTAAAENVVVKDMLNYKLDLTTLEMVSSSHPYRSTLTVGNKLEFFYQGINLPAAIDDEPGSHGYIAFKIKPKNTVVLNDVIENTANIYFDYNYPIVTNTVSTTVTALKNNSFENASFSLYPNPTKNLLNITISDATAIKTISVYNLVGQKILSFKASNSINVSALPQGSYLLTLETTRGISTQRFIKI